jgi:uncharacterized protein
VEIKDEYELPASRETVWALLNDESILRECIPGCESLTASDKSHLDATVVVKVGPIKARFQGSVELTDLREPESYTIVGEGKGGAAGFAKGKAMVALEAIESGTKLSYIVDVHIGGKIAQLGSRLIMSTSSKLSREFFDRFSVEVTKAEQNKLTGSVHLEDTSHCSSNGEAGLIH